MTRCHPIVLLAGLLTVVRAQGQSVTQHPPSLILILRFLLWCNYVLLCVLPLCPVLYPGLLDFDDIPVYARNRLKENLDFERCFLFLRKNREDILFRDALRSYSNMLFRVKRDVRGDFLGGFNRDRG